MDADGKNPRNLANHPDWDSVHKGTVVNGLWEMFTMSDKLSLEDMDFTKKQVMKWLLEQRSKKVIAIRLMKAGWNANEANDYVDEIEQEIKEFDSEDGVGTRWVILIAGMLALFCVEIVGVLFGVRTYDVGSLFGALVGWELFAKRFKAMWVRVVMVILSFVLLPLVVYALISFAFEFWNIITGAYS